MIWVKLKGYKGYSASDVGAIRNDRTGRILKAGKAPNGYWHVSLPNGSGYVTKTVHRLICTSFHGNPPFPEAQVNYKDGLKENCRSDNLEWVSGHDNIHHAIRSGLRDSMCGHLHFAAKVSRQDALEICRKYRPGRGNGKLNRALADRFGISYSNMWKIATGRAYKESGIL